MNFQKKVKASIMAVIICGTAMATQFSVYAVSLESENDNDIIELKDGDLISDFNDDVLESAEVIVLNENTYGNNSIDEIKEVLDNGTDIIISDESIIVTNDFETDLEFNNLENSVAGYYISSNGGNYNVSPIEYGLMVDESESVEITEDEANNILNEIIEQEPIDVELVMEDANKLEGIDKLNELDDETITSLQASTALGNSFADNNKFTYFYKKGSSGGTSTTYQYSCANSKSGYSKIGSLNMLIYAIKIKTQKSTTYDAVYSTCTASGLNNKYVSKFNVNISVTNKKNNKIIDFTSPDGPESSRSGSISTQITSSGDVNLGTSMSYTYNPNKLKSVVPACGEKYVKTWKCTAYTGNEYKNRSWTVKPAIILKKSNGTKENVKCVVYVDYFQVGGGLRSYTIKNKAYCNLYFKNHKSA